MIQNLTVSKALQTPYLFRTRYASLNKCEHLVSWKLGSYIRGLVGTVKNLTVFLQDGSNFKLDLTKLKP